MSEANGELHPATLLAQAGSRWDGQTGAVSMPIYHSATFRHPALGRSTGYDYSRTGNPTRHVLEELMARIEGGACAYAFASGLAAIDTIFRLLRPGDRVIATADLYGGTFRLLEQVVKPYGLHMEYVDTADADAVEAAMERGVQALFLEVPSNPLLRVADIRRLAAFAHERGALVVVDNTFLTFCRQRPLELGADLVVYSATKYLCGHNDLVGGIVVAGAPELGERIGFLQNAVGAILGPMDAWLMVRSLKTLPLRLQRQEETAGRLAVWLVEHPRVGRVSYPGLPDHPGHALLKQQATGFGAMIAFEVGDADRIPSILSGVRVFLFAESLGGVESLITYPIIQTHADLDPAIREQYGINDRLLRLSVGAEDFNDLRNDLEAVL